MKRALFNVIMLAAGLVIGGIIVYLYAGRPAPQVQTPAKEAAAPAKAEKKILYYRNPMNPSVTSPVPMKDSMGMDYVPVYEEEAAPREAPPGTVRITPEKMQEIGVKSEAAAKRPLRRIIRTVGRVEPVEDRVFSVNSKVSGWVEKLYVNRTDQMVDKGTELLELYSPDLVAAEEEYLLAIKSLDRVKESPYPEVKKGAQDLVDAARQRLKYLDVTDDEIRAITASGKARRTLPIRSPGNGSVTEKKVVEGQKIEAGEPLFKIIDHSVVWVYGEVYEYEIPYVKTGDEATLFAAYAPGEVYRGRIEHIYSHLGSIRYEQEGGTETRTAKVRFELSNRDHRLKLGMYLNVELPVSIAKDALSVPSSAVIDTGMRQIVIIDRGNGTFEPREIKTGARADEYTQVLSGIASGEKVVTSANFLIDSESNLRAAVGAMEPQKAGPHPAGAPPDKTPAHAGHGG